MSTKYTVSPARSAPRSLLGPTGPDDNAVRSARPQLLLRGPANAPAFLVPRALLFVLRLESLDSWKYLGTFPCCVKFWGRCQEPREASPGVARGPFLTGLHFRGHPREQAEAALAGGRRPARVRPSRPRRRTQKLLRFGGWTPGQGLPRLDTRMRQRPRPAVTGVQGGAGAPPAVHSCRSVGHGACGQPRKPKLWVSTESALRRFPFSQRCPSDGREHSKRVPVSPRPRIPAQGQPAQPRGRARRRGGV